ncbi:hypothetical protein ACOMHN_034694 [Nucella lapillus]
MGTASSPYPTFQPWVQPAVLTPPSNHGYSQQSLPHLPTMGTASSPYPTFQPWVQPAVLTPPSNHGYNQQSYPTFQPWVQPAVYRWSRPGVTAATCHQSEGRLTTTSLIHPGKTSPPVKDVTGNDTSREDVSASQGRHGK